MSDHRTQAAYDRLGVEPRRYVTPEAHDPRDRFGLYRLCDCPTCKGKGKARHPDLMRGFTQKCPDCRGEGKVRQELATCETPEAVGVALVTLAREGEWTDAAGLPCALGLLERGAGKNGAGRWLVLPWGASPREVSAAGRLLGSARKKGSPSD